MTFKNQRHLRVITCLATFLFLGNTVTLAQEKNDMLLLSLGEVISMAKDSSLQAFIAENTLVAANWQYKNYKTGNLPTINLSTQPFSLNRSFTQQFVPQDSSFSFFRTENLNSKINLTANQDIGMTGGRLSIGSDLSRLVNFGDISNTQYNATPIRIGINQPLFAYNVFKWNKILEPLKFERAKLTYVQSAEKIALTTLDLFFELAKSELEMKIAQVNMLNADTLYQIGKQRFAITTIKESDLLNLRLEYLNNNTAYMQAQSGYQRSSTKIKNYLNISMHQSIGTNLSLDIPLITISPEFALQQAQMNNPRFLEMKEQDYRSASDVERAKKANRFSADFNASVGLNQRAPDFDGAYRNPSEQQRFNVSLDVPLVDWGLGKGRYILAQRERETALASIKQQRNELEQEIIITVTNFNIRKESVSNSKEAATVANRAYEINKKRFIEGLTDINTLVIQQQRRDAAQKRYLSELEIFWKSYFQIRSMTLYDFENDISLVTEIDDKF